MKIVFVCDVTCAVLVLTDCDSCKQYMHHCMCAADPSWYLGNSTYASSVTISGACEEESEVAVEEKNVS